MEGGLTLTGDMMLVLAVLVVTVGLFVFEVVRVDMPSPEPGRPTEAAAALLSDGQTVVIAGGELHHYGRDVEVVYYQGTGDSSDPVTAQAAAVEIAEEFEQPVGPFDGSASLFRYEYDSRN